MFISNTAINRPVTTILLTGTILLFGFLSVRDMGVDLFPEVDMPVVTVTANWPGADADVIDSDVTDVLEREINTIEGIDSLRSSSSEGRSRITVEFVLERDIDIAAQEVRDAINLAQRRLPRDVDPPIVRKVDAGARAIMWVTVTGMGDYRDMAVYADQVVRERLQTVLGVGAVQFGGFREREIRVWLEPRTLEAYGLSPADIGRAIRAKHMELPGGRIENYEQEQVIKVMGEYQSVDELESLVLRAENGGVVRLGDIALVTDGAADMRNIARRDGRPAIGLGIQRQAGANIVAVASEVRAVVEELKQGTPPGIDIQVASDQSEFIQRSMNDVMFDLFFGALLTSLTILVFLRNFRMAFISVMAIPTAIVGSFVAMYFMGFTINNMTMLAMALAMGIVIDDAIVVLENTFRHVEQFGKGSMQAARDAVTEVGPAVIAAASAIVAVFVPVAFMGGTIGRFFYQFGMSVAMAVGISLVASLTLTPMLCSRLLKHQTKHGRLFTFFERGFRATESFYGRSLNTALRFRWVTLAAAAGVFAGGMALYPFVDTAFTTDADESRFLVRYEFPTGTSIHRSNEGMRKLEALLSETEEVDSFMAIVGGGGGVNNGMIFTNMTRPHQREASQFEVIARLREKARELLPDAMVIIAPLAPQMGAGGRSADIDFVIQGPNVDALREVSDAVVAELRETEGFIDVDTDLRLSQPEIHVAINRHLADDLGVDVAAIAENFNILFGGQDVAYFKDAGRRYDVRLRARPEFREHPEQLFRMAVRSGAGEMIQAANLIDIQETTGAESINRYNRRQSVTVSTNLDGIALGDAITQVQAIAGRHVPPGPDWSTALTGEAQVFQESFGYLLTALFIALILIYVVLGSQFESFIHPFTILLSVPLAAIGGLGLLFITGNTLDIFSAIGFIMLTGIVSKNAILLVDFINKHREYGLERDDAIRKAAPLRLRPILMTAFTTMAALTPVALAFSEGGEQRAPMGIAVIGGLLTSTLLTLMVIPCAYTVMDDFGGFVRRVLAPFLPEPEEAHAVSPEESEVKG